MGWLQSLFTRERAEPAAAEGVMNPQDILFSTPTLNNALPEVSDVSAAADCCRMHEDDWRQFEFVSPALDAAVARELESIDRMWREASVSVGEGMTAFRELHVRELVVRPLDIAMTRAEFETLFGAACEPLTFLDYPAICRDVWAIRLQDVIVYAQFDSDRLAALGFEAHERFTISGAAGDRLEAFVTRNDLRLVHWRSRTLFGTPQAAMKYLRDQS